MRDHSVAHERGGARKGWKTIWMAVATLALALPALVVGTTDVVQAAGGTTLSAFRVENSNGGAQITHYKWLVNLDNTGDPAFTAPSVKDCLPNSAGPDPRLPGADATGGDLANCPWPSMRAVPGDSPVIASGTDADVSRLTALSTFNAGNGPGNGRYLISVTARDFKIDGVHFEVKNGALVTVNDDAVGPTVPFTVKMNPMPKLTATVRVHVYNDNASTNGQWDGQTETLLTCAAPGDGEVLPAGCNGIIDANVVADPETDMSGFTVSIKDVLADVTTDVFGNPLCTEYSMDTNDPTKVYLDEFGSPTPVSFGSTLGGTESSCISDHYGDVVIPNLGPNRYAASIIAPDARTHEDDQWVQTTTLEGGHDWDTWNQEGGSGYDTELVVGGERVTPVAHGFVKLTHSDYEYAEMIQTMGVGPAKTAYYDASSGFTGGTPGTGVLSGAIHVGRAYIGSGAGAPLAGTNLANAKDAGVIEDGLISINCIATCSAPTDSAVWVGRADPTNGSFTVTGLQSGDYSVAFWDEAQSYILAVLQYHVEGQPVASTTPLAGLVSAQRTGTNNSNRRYYLNFATAPTIPTGVTQLNVTSPNNNNGWNGLFNIVAVNGTQVEVRKATGPQPGGNGSNVTAMTVSYTTTRQPVPTDAGNVLLPGWFSDLQGTIFIDDNENGVQDAGEAGVPDFGVTVRTRGNSLQDQGAAATATGEDGSYDLSQAYPLGQFLIFEAYNPRYYTTGYNYSTDNDSGPHVVVGTGQVDFNFLPIIGLSGQINVGVKPYAPFENGGIAGTVSYDVTRNEFDPAFSAAEDYQPSVPGLPVQLWKTAKTADGSVIRYGDKNPVLGNPNTSGSGAAVQIGINAAGACLRADQARGSDALVTAGQTCFPWDYYVTEHWTRPTGCVALDINGNTLDGELVLPGAPAGFDDSHSDPANPDCVEAPMNGMQIGGDGSVNGNYALSNLITPSAAAAAAAGNAAARLDVYSSDHDNAANWDVLPPDDYIVEVVNPVDKVGGAKAKDPDEGGFYSAGNTAKHLFRFTDETSINVFSGNSYVPQRSVQPVSTPDGGGDPLAPFDPNVERKDLNTIGAGTVALCGGTMQTIHNSTSAVEDESDFTDGGGSPFDGQARPVCDAKVVKVVNGRSVAPTFFVYTDVPIPSKFYGLINDDLNVQTDRRSTLLGEVAPVSNGPIGIYDELGRWKYTAHSDVNGNYEVLLPSMDTYNCPLPAGPCANVYRLVGNDPGTLFHRNTDYNPQFRTIATNFQAWAGVIHPVDQAPTHIGITIEGPAAQFGALSLCQVNDFTNAAAPVTPEIFSINRPYYDPGTDNGNTVFVLKGQGFGANGVSQVRLDTTGMATTWISESELRFTVPANLTPGARQLSVKNNTNGLSSVNGLTFHRLSPTSGAGSNDYLRKTDVYEVRSHSDYTNPGSVLNNDNTGSRVFTPMHDAWDTTTGSPAGFSGRDINNRTVNGGRAIQRAVERAYRDGNSGQNAKLVVIYPNEAPNYANFNANAAYFENVVLHGKVMLQGVGTGGVYTSTKFVHGAAIDASTFWAANGGGTNPQVADGAYSDDWRLFANGITRADTEVADLPEGEAILAIAEDVNQWAALTVDRGTSRSLSPRNPQFVDVASAAAIPPTTRKNGVDGLLITGGNQQGNPGGVNTAPGAVGADVALGGQPGPAQGGAITLDRYVRDFRITNNLIESNGGTYGAIRIGTPDLPNQDNHNERPVISSNRIIANGGTNLAGALGLFFGADLYKVQGNDFCGNFSAEYGGAISHYGSSPGGTIDHNRIYYNQSYDEGGAVFIAGNLPASTNSLSAGAGGTYVESVGTTNQRLITTSAPAGVTVDANLIVSNQSNDDGGGVRFLMAAGNCGRGCDGNFPFVVSNNMIANNLATHEGAGIAIDDTPNVTVINNTVVKNITTGTAATNAAVTTTATLDVGAIVPAGVDVTVTGITSDPGPLVRPQNPAGLATGGNSTQLQNSLPNHAPNWSKPTLVNNLFADNRAGWAETPTTANFNQNAIHAIGVANLSDAEERWDIGVSAATGLCNSFNNVTHTCDSNVFTFTGDNNTTNTSNLAQAPTGYAAYLGTSNIAAGDGTAAIGFVKPVDFLVDSLGWRVNTNVSFPVIVAQMAPVTLLANYHLADTASTVYAVGRGTAPVGCPATGTPCNDIDGQSRGAGTDRGADEITGAQADVSITKTDGKAVTTPGGTNTYTITVHNSGPSAATGVTVTDTLSASFSGATWGCSGSCAPGVISGTGSINQTINLASGATATYTLIATVANSATAPVLNTATATAAITDPNPANNTATDSDAFPPARPTLATLDDFERGNANNLGSNWSQVLLANFGALRVSARQASANSTGNAFWSAAQGASQYGGFTVANTTFVGDAIVLKSSGGVTVVPQNFVRVRVATGNGTCAPPIVSPCVVVESTTNFGINFTTLATLTGAVANGSTLVARIDNTGHVDVWLETTWLGSAEAGASFDDETGRIGVQMPTGARIDNFVGGAA